MLHGNVKLMGTISFLSYSVKSHSYLLENKLCMNSVEFNSIVNVLTNLIVSLNMSWNMCFATGYRGLPFSSKKYPFVQKFRIFPFSFR